MSEHEPEREPEHDLTLRYMTRFACIGAACEDHCCHTWRVEVDRATYERLELATLTHPGERRRLEHAIIKEPREPGARRTRRVLRLHEGGGCAMLRPDGLCHIQARHGERLLPDVCATYPRRIQRVEGRLELTGLVSCPEVARQLLLTPDATDRVPLDRDAQLSRIVVTHRVDPRDARPYMRLQRAARGFVYELLEAPALPLEHRLFLTAYLAKRLAPTMRKDTDRFDPAPARREMEVVRDPQVRDAICRRFAQVEAPSALVMLLVRALLQPAGAPDSHTRASFRDLVRGTLGTYTHLADLAARDDAAADAPDPTEARDDAAADAPGPSEASIDEVWDDYTRRRAAIRALAAERVDQHLTRFAINYWAQRLMAESPDMLVHTLRMLTQMAVHKFFFYSHPRVRDALAAPTPDRAALEALLDEVAVEVLYKCARYIEHSTLLNRLELALEHQQLRSIAGAVYLIRF